MSQAPDIAPGRLPAEAYERNFADLHPPLEPARGPRRRRALPVLLRRALRAGLPDRDRHPAVHPPDRDRQPARVRQDDPRRRTSWAACAPASARPRPCARRPACAKSPRASRSRSAACSATPPTRLFAHGPAALSSRAPPPAATRGRGRRRAGGPRLRAPAGDARPRGHRASTRRRQARRPQRIRHRRLQDRRTISPRREVAMHPGRRRHRAAHGRSVSAATSRLPSSAGILTRCSSVSASPASTPWPCRTSRPSTGPRHAVHYIEELRQADDLAALPVGRRVVVIGGGMTAIDKASQAKRLGAEDVTMVYRRGPDKMGANASTSASWRRPTASRSSSTRRSRSG